MLTVKIDGFTVTCESPEEMLRLIRAASKVENAVVVGAIPEPRLVRQEPIRDFLLRGNGSDARSLTVLTTIHGVGETGITGADLAKVIGLAEPRGLGPVLSQLRRQLDGSSINFDEVMGKHRQDDERRWFAGPRIGEAIKIMGGH